MAGSIFDKKYLDDRGNEWAVRIDEDKSGIEGAGFTDILAEDDLDFLPVGFKMRGINCVKTTGDGAGYIHRFVPCGSEDADLYTGEQKTFDWNGATWSVTSTKGEKRRTPQIFNSGLQGQSSEVGKSSEGGGGGTT